MKIAEWKVKIKGEVSDENLDVVLDAIEELNIDDKILTLVATLIQSREALDGLMVSVEG